MRTDSDESHDDAAGDTATESSAESAYSTPPFLVAAVGASAGGLEAFSELIGELPAGANLSLVLVQHLARDQLSALPEILSRHTALGVVKATDGLRIEASQVYIIPSDAHLTVIDHHLRLHPRPVGPGGDQVDVLFRSFAEFYREKAVGVVLSGSASDGAAGLREIKAAGGITIVQAPDGARVDGMPRAAIATGAVDLILPARKIAEELLRLAELPLFREPARSAAPPEGPDNDEASLLTIFKLLRRTTGVDFGYYKRPTVLRRIARRMALRRVSSMADYSALLQKEPLEVENLYEDVLIHVTRFFREQESFIALAGNVLPALLKQKEEGPLRVWVPGCSTGEEVYSLAMVLFEALGPSASGARLQIFGTDVSNLAVETARVGVYPESISADVSAERLKNYFARIEGGYRISKVIRECCVFAHQDITRDPPFSRLDMIVCRNMLIYLGQEIQRKVMAVLHYALQPHGYLMLGRAESTGPNGDLFNIVDKRFKIYGRKAGSVSLGLDLRAASPAETSTLGARRAPRSGDIQIEADRLLMTRYAPPSIVVDSAFHVLAVRGHTADFLELPSGEISLDVLKMVRASLLVGLRGALHEARTLKAPVRKVGLPLLGTHGARSIDIEVTPLGNATNPHYLVLFEEIAANKEAAPRAPDSVTTSLGGEQSEYEALHQELAITRDQLRANIHDLAGANEELQSANEEILSSNEELQSTNEELDTAKEELQSTNEELSTLNEELRSRNDDLTIANGDLNNLLASVQIPIVMVDDDLSIRRFTPAAERVLNLIPSDAGRPIGHINPNINCPDLESLIAEVIQTVTVLEREVEGRDGRRYSLRIRPYKSVENRIEGAVLTLFDISTVTDALTATEKTRDAILMAVRDPILLLTPELRIESANRAYHELFRTSPGELEGRFVYEITNQLWDIAELRKLLEAAGADQRNFRDFRVKGELPGTSPRSFVVDGSAIEPDKRAGLLVLVIREERADANP